MTQDARNSLQAWLTVSAAAALFALTLYLLRDVDTRSWQPLTSGILSIVLLLNFGRVLWGRRHKAGGSDNG